MFEHLGMSNFVKGERHIRHDLGSTRGAFQMNLRRRLSDTQSLVMRILLEKILPDPLPPSEHMAGFQTARTRMD